MKRACIWIAYGIVGLVCVLCAIVIIFNVERIHREVETAALIAPHTGHFVTAADVQVFVQEYGPPTGPAIVLIHGTGTWSEIWRDTSTALAHSGFHVIALDLPPFGYSDKPRGATSYSREAQAKRILGVLDSLHIEHATLVGHSVGARPTIEAALESPGKIERLILVDPALGFGNTASATPYFGQNHPSWLVRTFFSFKLFRNAVLSTYGTNPLSIKSLLSSFVSRKESITDARVETIEKPMVIRGTTDAYGDWLQNLTVYPDNSLSSDFTHFENLRMPVFIIWGQKDTVTPLWQGQDLARLIPRSHLSIIPGVGHIPYIEDTDAFNSELLNILQK